MRRPLMLLGMWLGAAAFVPGQSQTARQGGTLVQEVSSRKVALEQAVGALRRMEKVADIRTPLRDYSRELDRVRDEVELHLRRIEPSSVRPVAEALEAYLDAATAWEEMIRYDFMSAEYEPGTTLAKKYAIPASEDLTGRVMSRRVVLGTIWKAARRHTDRAAGLAEK